MAFFDTKATVEGGAWLPSHNEKVGEPSSCFMCKEGDVAADGRYRPSPCGCFTVCKKCAMKCATGGKCRLCKQFYTHLTNRPINVAKIQAAAAATSAGSDDEDEEDEEASGKGEKAAAAQDYSNDTSGR